MKRFDCIQRLSDLHRGDEVFVGDHPDARFANLLFKDVIDANHPSGLKYTFKDGYIRFRKEVRYFDRAQRCLRSRMKTSRLIPTPAFIFRVASATERAFAKTKHKQQIAVLLKAGDPEDMAAFAEVVYEKATGLTKRINRWQAFEVAMEYLEELSLLDLEAVHEMLEAPPRPPESSSSAIAA